MCQMKNKAIVDNIGHFNKEIDIAGMAKTPGIVVIRSSRRCNEWTFDRGSSIVMLSEGRLLNLGNSTGHRSTIWRSRSR
jgi:adenosylhomocysteinase